MKSPETTDFLLLFRNTDWCALLAPDEIQEVMDRTYAWFDQLYEAGIAKAGQPLETEGSVISHRNGSITDGPFVETKESVGGYVLITARDFEEAVSIARQNPMIPLGLMVEVRQIAGSCPKVKLAMERAAAVHA